MDTVTAILIERSREARSVRPMVIVSMVAHVSVVLAMALGPKAWPQDRTPRTVMTISLGGAPGPANGGNNPIGGRAIQKAVTEEPARPEPLRAPAARTPEMTVPVPTPKTTKPAKEAKEPPPTVKDAPRDARGHTLSTGPQERFGSTVAETGGFGFGSGISTGGGGTASGMLDVGTFCCPDYLNTMIRLISQNWNSRQGVVGMAVLKFTILRDGRLSDVTVEQSSGFAALDLAAQRALLMTRQIPALPSAFPDSSLTVHLRFQYQR